MQSPIFIIFYTKKLINASLQAKNNQFPYSKIYYFYGRRVVTIFKYIFLGIIIYVIVLPLLEQIASVLTQYLENLKGLAMIKAQEIQNRIYELGKETPEETEQTHTQVIGFQLPEEEEYYEEEEVEDD